MKFSFVHEFDTDVKSYWELFLSDDFNKVMLEALGMKNIKLISKEDDGTTFRRSQSMEPTLSLPSMFAKFVPDMGYSEHDTLVWSTNTMKVVIEPRSMKDKFKTTGDYIVTPLGDNRCRREFKGEVSMSIPFIGGKMESYTVDQMKASYEAATRVTREWIAKKKG